MASGIPCSVKHLIKALNINSIDIKFGYCHVGQFQRAFQRLTKWSFRYC